MSKKNVAIIGLGYVGLPLALLADLKGYDVTGIDNDEQKINQIKKGISPFLDKQVSLQLKKTNIKVSINYSNLQSMDIIVICVPTPVDSNYVPNLEALSLACREIAIHLRPKQVIIVESTINPGVCEDIVLPILEESGLKCGLDFFLSHCPERINPGDPKWNVTNIPRVIGANDSISLQKSVEFYKSIITGNIKALNSLKEAEAVKVVENSFRDINIAFVNELAMSFSKLGIDVVNVIEAAATKPFAFMAHYPGVGVGGHCIPVDPYYLISYAKTKGFSHKFLSIARKINNGMPLFVMDQLISVLDSKGLKLQNLNVTVLGLSYKPQVGDIRESPSLKLIDLLLKHSANIAVYDPFISTHSYATSHKQNNKLKESSAVSAIQGSNIVIIATAHKAFINLKIKEYLKAGVSIIVDGRNCIDKKAITSAGIVYIGVGR